MGTKVQNYKCYVHLVILIQNGPAHPSWPHVVLYCQTLGAGLLLVLERLILDLKRGEMIDMFGHNMEVVEKSELSYEGLH